MFNNIIKDSNVLENKKSNNKLLYTVATLVTLTISSGSNEVYASNSLKNIYFFQGDSNFICINIPCPWTIARDNLIMAEAYKNNPDWVRLTDLFNQEEDQKDEDEAIYVDEEAVIDRARELLELD